MTPSPQAPPPQQATQPAGASPQQRSDPPPERGPISGVHRAVRVEAPAAPPLLASELLRAEAAPLHPCAGAARLWLAGAAAALVFLGGALQLGAAQSGAAASAVAWALAGAVGSLAALPFPYALRGWVALGVAAIGIALGVGGVGPLALLTDTPAAGHEVARLAAVLVLPPALLFRGRYGAFEGSRRILILALAVALPFLGLEAFRLIGDDFEPASRVAAALGVLGVLGAWTGLAPREDVSRGSSALASLVLFALPIGTAFEHLDQTGAAPLDHVAFAIALLCVALVATSGAFLLLAQRFGVAARRALDARPA